MKHNVVLVHGFLGTAAGPAFRGPSAEPNRAANYFRGVKRLYRNQGGPSDDIRVIEPDIGEGAPRDLARNVLYAVETAVATAQLHPNSPTHFICHSQGGLDTRFALANIRTKSSYQQRYPLAARLLNDRRSLVGGNAHTYVSIGTPHYGTPLADVGKVVFALMETHGTSWYLNLPGHMAWIGAALGPVTGGSSAVLKDIVASAGPLARACQGMSTTASNVSRIAALPRHPSVKHHCIGTNHSFVFDPFNGLALTGPAFFGRVGTAFYNDGVVPTASAEWSGATSLTRTLRGGWSTLDHAGQIGHRFNTLFQNSPVQPYNAHLYRYALLLRRLMRASAN